MDDAIQNGPLLRMLNRPALQAQTLEEAANPTQIFTGWSDGNDGNFYIAFKLSGLSQNPVRTVRNFVDYQFRRAWGEDLCQVLIQPIYADNTVGPVLHVACKPNGGEWTERKLDPRLYADPWQPVVSAGVRYVATPDGTDWRGELAIPWKTINDTNKSLPVMLRFNFIHHRTETGESPPVGPAPSTSAATMPSWESCCCANPKTPACSAPPAPGNNLTATPHLAHRPRFMQSICGPDARDLVQKRSGRGGRSTRTLPFKSTASPDQNGDDLLLAGRGCRCEEIGGLPDSAVRALDHADRPIAHRNCDSITTDVPLGNGDSTRGHQASTLQ
jgi:hypothetical protein